MKKKGFTLIELLAVIVILAIIALITVPVVINIISNSKKGAAEDSTYGVIEAAKLYWISNNGSGFESEGSTIVFKYTDGEWKTGSQVLQIGGTKPTGDDDSNIKITNGTIEVNNLKFGEYYCSANSDGKAVCSKEKSSGGSTSNLTIVTVPGATHKGIAYLNPKDLTVECNESNSQIGTGSANASGCMKFYIFDDSGDTYKMILDHNTTNKVAWNSEGTNATMNEVATALSNNTTGWEGNPRLITGNELAAITNTTTYNGNTSTWFYFDGSGSKKQTEVSTTQGSSVYAWLYDYSKECTAHGCNIADANTSGYWTSSAVADSSDYTWFVRSHGLLTRNPSNSTVSSGVRPVIELSKSLFN